MTVTSTPPTGECDLVVNQGSTWTQQLLIVDSNDIALDFTGCDARMMVRQFKDSATPLETLTTANGKITLQPGDSATVTPNIVLTLTDADTAALSDPGKGAAWRYDLEIVYADGSVWRPLEGKFTLSGEVTR